MQRVRENKTTVPAGKGEHFHSEDGKKCLLLHQTIDEEAVLEGFPQGSGRGPRREQTMLDCVEILNAVGVIHPPCTSGLTGQSGHITGGQVDDGTVSSLPLSALADQMEPSAHREGKVHHRVDEVRVQTALFNQSQRRALGPDCLKFSALCLQ